jgi:predicted nucleic acid-binding protein
MSSTSVKTFVDTNVLVYAIDDAEPSKRDRARDLLQSLGAEEIVLSAQVLAEFYVVVTRKLAHPMSPADAAAAVGELARLRVVPVDGNLVDESVALSRRADLSLWDALVIRAAAVAGCGRVLSEDLAHGSKLAGVRIENPFL